MHDVWRAGRARPPGWLSAADALSEMRVMIVWRVGGHCSEGTHDVMAGVWLGRNCLVLGC